MIGNPLNKDAIRGILERIQTGDVKGPNMGLDADIECAMGFWTEQHFSAWHAFQEAGGCVNPPLYEPAPPNPYSRSIDAALRLAPKGHDYILMHVNNGLTIGARVCNDPDQVFWADTLPLAIIGACLEERLLSDG